MGFATQFLAAALAISAIAGCATPGAPQPALNPPEATCPREGGELVSLDADQGSAAKSLRRCLTYVLSDGLLTVFPPELTVPSQLTAAQGPSGLEWFGWSEANQSITWIWPNEDVQLSIPLGPLPMESLGDEFTVSQSTYGVVGQTRHALLFAHDASNPGQQPRYFIHGWWSPEIAAEVEWFQVPPGNAGQFGFPLVMGEHSVAWLRISSPLSDALGLTSFGSADLMVASDGPFSRLATISGSGLMDLGSGRAGLVGCGVVEDKLMFAMQATSWQPETVAVVPRGASCATAQGTFDIVVLTRFPTVPGIAEDGESMVYVRKAGVWSPLAFPSPNGLVDVVATGDFAWATVRSDGAARLLAISETGVTEMAESTLGSGSGVNGIPGSLVGAGWTTPNGRFAGWAALTIQ